MGRRPFPPRGSCRTRSRPPRPELGWISRRLVKRPWFPRAPLTQASGEADGRIKDSSARHTEAPRPKRTRCRSGRGRGRASAISTKRRAEPCARYRPKSQRRFRAPPRGGQSKHKGPFRQEVETRRQVRLTAPLGALVSQALARRWAGEGRSHSCVRSSNTTSARHRANLSAKESDLSSSEPRGTCFRDAPSPRTKGGADGERLIARDPMRTMSIRTFSVPRRRNQKESAIYSSNFAPLAPSRPGYVGASGRSPPDGGTRRRGKEGQHQPGHPGASSYICRGSAQSSPTGSSSTARPHGSFGRPKS